MSARWMTLLVWAAVAASALAWGLRVWVRPLAVPAHAQVAEPGGPPRGDLTRLLGADVVAVAAATPEPAADARYTLVGVVSPRSPQAAREGLALIAVDGKPAKTYRVGAVVEGGQVLKSVSARGATLGPSEGAATIALNIAPPPAAATGTLPAAGAAGPTGFGAPAPAPSATVLPRPMIPQPPMQLPPPGLPQNLPQSAREPSLR
jgi:general secretion pathway protein C